MEQIASSNVTQVGTLTRFSLYSKAIDGNPAGESAERDVMVYLPPSYATSNKTYPVIYLLHGMTASPAEWFESPFHNPQCDITMNTLIRSGAVDEMILVAPCAKTALGGSWYLESTITGDWPHFICEELVSEIEQRYRVHASASKRALIGHSMGGIGAMTLTNRYPTLFGYVAALSPANPMLESSPVTEGDWQFFEQQLSILEAGGEPEWMTYVSLVFLQHYFPDTGNPPYYYDHQAASEQFAKLADYNLETLFVDWTPTRLSPQYFAEMGTQEGEYKGKAITERFNDVMALLKRKGMNLDYEVFEGGHCDKIADRMRRVFLRADRFFHAND
ncbi:alpha/beta hydrolase [Thaumasiovibrio subtropicus]|uniref:alpha/beta hydrolase n=1 Tax=Thaumasiovibrio subtropicus TaxID=1891207 RepID=UPI000B356589|nr:alpha/beta fold hydrolase [Thaumasiovibrio subtropicus]